MRAPGHHQFPCGQCGALQAYAPGTRALECPYCGHVTAITESSAEVREYPLDVALARLATAPRAGERISTQCQNCAAEFDFDADVHAGECPFCATPIVTGTGRERHISPKSLLPFRVEEEQAREAFRGWLGRLWFAPARLQRYARNDAKLNGVYLPYWTYDAMTRSSYRGERGDVYYVRVPYTTRVNGRRVTRMRREARVRWTPVRGTVSRFFDDVLVGASTSLPRQIADRLAPWDLENLVPYDERFLSGFRSEVYQVGLDQGFQRAVEIMDRVIRTDIARDIGGDQQRIHLVDTQRYGITFKHLLLPVWSAGFRFRDRTFRFVVNARTGKVQGERPYSVIKIVAAIAGTALLVSLTLLALHLSGLL